jgi:hypothetical protein
LSSALADVFQYAISRGVSTPAVDGTVCNISLGLVFRFRMTILDAHIGMLENNQVR